MSSWAIVAVVAIGVWGIVQMVKARHGIVTDKQGNETRAVQDDDAARREIEELRERIKVLERIATDGNSIDAQETKRIAAEIEALRSEQDERA